MTVLDLVAAIEQAYDTTKDDVSWLHNLTQLTAPAFGESGSASAYFFEIVDNHVVVGETVSVGQRPYTREHYLQLHEFGKKYGSTAVAYRCESFTLLSRVVGSDLAREVLRSAGMHGDDSLGLRANSTPTTGVLITTPVGAGYRIKDRNLWTRFAAYVGDALRLRDLRRAQRSATAESRTADKLQRVTPDAARKFWNVLVTGQWRLVDWLDHDGKRFLIAQENPLRATGKTTLTRRERQVVACAALGHSNKLIAHDLGVSTGTVSVFLTRAAKKLGVSSRVALIRAFREGRA